jgi:hypothetical protein
MARTQAQNIATYKYNKEHLKRVPLDMQKTDYEILKQHVNARGETVNGFIKRAISETIERDNNQ